MKKFAIILQGLALSAVIFSCAREPMVVEAEMMTIGVEMPEVPASKVTVSQEERALGLYWETGDQLRVVGSSSELFSLVSGAGQKSAVFSGKSVSGSSFTVFYPGNYSNKEALMARSYEGQVQNGNGSTSHLAFNVINESVSDLEHIDFSAARRSGAFKFTLTMPDEVSQVTKLALNCTSPILYKTNASTSGTYRLTMNLSDIDLSTSEHTLTAYMMTSMQDVVCGADDVFSINVYLPDGSYYEKTFTPGAMTLYGGRCHTISLKSTGWTQMSEDGSAAHPYVIRSPDDLLGLEARLTEGNLTYFRLAADLDLSSISNWTPICPASNNKGIDFDGGDHTISGLTVVNSGQYGGLFGFLVGRVRHLNFENPRISVSNSGSNMGVLAGALENKSACTRSEIMDVHVSNGMVSFTHNDYRAYLGGLIGTVSVPVIISDCSYDGTVSVVSNYSQKDYPFYVGGIAGWSWAGGVAIEDCQVRGTVSSSSQGSCGGVIGFINKNNTSVSRCLVEAAVSANNDYCGGVVGMTNILTSGSIVISDCCSTGAVNSVAGGWAGGVAGSIGYGTQVQGCLASGAISGKYQALGGIVGAASNHAKVGANSNFSNVISSCIAWNPSVRSLYPYDYKPDTNSGHISSGAVVGFGGDKNTYADCRRRPDMDYAICTQPASWLNSLVLFDQENASASSPLSQKGGSVDGSALTATFHPYHGKAASSTQSASDVARSLSWDSEVWDLSGDVPSLLF